MNFKEFCKFIFGPIKPIEIKPDDGDPEYQRILDKFNKPEYTIRTDSHLKLVWDREKQKK